MSDETKVCDKLCKVIKELDQKWAEAPTDASGTTATILFQCGCEMYIVTVGDSRCVLVSHNLEVASDLNAEQRISLPQERERLKKLAPSLGVTVLSQGKDIEFEKPYYQILFDEDKLGQVSKIQVIVPPKVQQKWNMRVGMCSIALSSTIGDCKFGPIIAPCPVVKHYTLTEKGLVILATDGLWDVVSNTEVFDIVAQNTKEFNPNEIKFDELDIEIVRKIMASMVETLPQFAYDKYGPKDHMRDDITILVVYV